MGAATPPLLLLILKLQYIPEYTEYIYQEPIYWRLKVINPSNITTRVSEVWIILKLQLLLIPPQLMQKRTGACTPAVYYFGTYWYMRVTASWTLAIAGIDGFYYMADKNGIARLLLIGTACLLSIETQLQSKTRLSKPAIRTVHCWVDRWTRHITHCLPDTRQSIKALKEIEGKKE